MNDEKIAKWRAIAEKSPQDELARFTLARACLDAGKLADARTSFEAVVGLKDDWMMAWILLGRCLVELGEKEPAVAALTKARALAIAQDHTDPLVEIDELLESVDG